MKTIHNVKEKNHTSVLKEFIRKEIHNILSEAFDWFDDHSPEKIIKRFIKICKNSSFELSSSGVDRKNGFINSIANVVGTKTPNYMFRIDDSGDLYFAGVSPKKNTNKYVGNVFEDYNQIKKFLSSFQSNVNESIDTQEMLYNFKRSIGNKFAITDIKYDRKQYEHVITTKRPNNKFNIVFILSDDGSLFYQRGKSDRPSRVYFGNFVNDKNKVLKIIDKYEAYKEII